MRKQALVFTFVPFVSLFFGLMLTSACLADSYMDNYEKHMAWMNKIFDKGESLPPKSKENAKTMYASKSEVYFYGLRITEEGEQDSAFGEYILNLGGKQESFTTAGSTLTESPRIYRNIANGNVLVMTIEGYRGGNILAYHSNGKTYATTMGMGYSPLKVLSIKGTQYLLYSVGSCFGAFSGEQSMAEQTDVLRVAVFEGKGFVPGKIGQQREVYQMLITDVLEKQKKRAADKEEKNWTVLNPALQIAFYQVMMGEDPKKVTKELTAALPKKDKPKIKSAMEEILATASDEVFLGRAPLEGNSL